MSESSEPIAAKTKIQEALSILRALGVPREQQNERSALTLLALLDLVQSLLNRKGERILEMLQSNRSRMKVMIPREIQLPADFPQDLKNAVFLP